MLAVTPRIAWVVIIPLLGACAPKRIDLHNHPSHEYEEIYDTFELYKSPQARDDQDSATALAVVISGGGHRAANLGAGALLGLEQIQPDALKGRNMLSEVDMFSTVSGGGFGVAAYISSFRDYSLYCSDQDNYSFASLLSGTADDNCHDPSMLRQLERGYKDDALSHFNPFKGESWRVWFTNLDRTNLLERAVDNDVLGADWRRCVKGESENHGSLNLREVFVPRNAPDTEIPHLPLWVANATIYENGQIFPMTPEVLGQFGVIDYTHRLSQFKYCSNEDNDYCASEDQGRYLDDYEQFLFNVPLSLALTASGNFPVALPATTLRSNKSKEFPYIHLLDGGLGDNIGVLTAVRYLKEEDPSYKVSRKILIVVDAYQGPISPYSEKEGSPTADKSALRTTSVGLDGWRGRYREMIERIDQENEIKKIFITPDILDDPADMENLYAGEIKAVSTPGDCTAKKQSASSIDWCPAGSQPTQYHTAVTDNSNQFDRCDGDRLIKEWKKEHQEQLSEKNNSREPSPLDLFREIPTDYNVSPERQRFLLALGRYLVIQQADDILK